MPASRATNDDAPSVTTKDGSKASSPTPPAQRRRRGRTEPAVPLGSLTQREHQTEIVCAQCGSNRVTRLALNLTDGTPVNFISCHRCEHKTWDHEGTPLSVDTVLERTRRD
ncbi:hypothetical protein ACIB24_15095 [Spongisporangium articulatum]|uniref:Uncharacterized protein n=1 Tax=Spongisporangium articulatum TaxID=3362603 RepID=A0ABW8APU7_9ACTN